MLISGEVQSQTSPGCWFMCPKEGWAPKNWCFWTVVLEKTLKSPLDSKEIKWVHPKEISPEYSLEGLMLKLKLQYFGPWWEENSFIGKDPDAGKDWRWEEKGATEDEIVGWPHRLNEHEFEQTPGDSEGEGSLVCCSPWGCKEWDTTERPNNNSLGYLVSSQNKDFLCLLLEVLS